MILHYGYLRLIPPVSYYSRNWGMENLTALRTAPYQGMEVWDQDSFGRIAFSAQQEGLSHLGTTWLLRIILFVKCCGKRSPVIVILPVIPCSN